MSQGQGGGSHSLAFRVMRLCRPSFNVDPPLRLDPTDLFVGEDLFDDPAANTSSLSAATNHDSDPNYRNRFLLHHFSDAMGLSGLLVLPQSFGAIYLGETFCSYISINNSSNFEVREIIIKAEIQTERQRILLLDTSKSPVESIRAGGRYDFIVEHDVKELGPHTLVCTALYNDGDGERKYLPQFFKFIVANPLSVKTKVRVIKETTFLEACIENHTKSNLFMDQVDFEPVQYYSATILKGDVHHSEKDSPTRETFKPPILIRSGGGIYNYLYQLKTSSDGSSQTKVEGSNVLGKLQITWRTNLGEPGRLQTQQILGTPSTKKEIELQVVEVPSIINLQNPFTIKLNLTNQTDRELGPFEVSLSQNGLYGERVVMINGLQSMVLSQVQAFGSTDFHLYRDCHVLQISHYLWYFHSINKLDLWILMQQTVLHLYRRVSEKGNWPSQWVDARRAKMESRGIVLYEVTMGNMRKNKLWDIHCANLAYGTRLVGEIFSKQGH